MAQGDTADTQDAATSPTIEPVDSPQQRLYNSRVVLTTYPSQLGIDPIPMRWGAATAAERGPVVVSRSQDTFGKRNAIGAGGGSYCIYRALAVAIGALAPNHRPDFNMTEPTHQIGPFPAWSDPEKIVSMDPWGHATVEHYGDYLERGVDIRPTIAITKAHMKLAEIDEAIERGFLRRDGDIVTQGGELKVVKVASEPVWYLPGVAQRFGIGESTLRRALFEDTGGMYPELITRPDLKVFLPPIGGLTVYIFGDPAHIPDPSKRLTMRVHDECNGSDVFGSDICTCKPYLIYSIEECAREAQNGGVGVVVYFRKEGRALGEVTKYLVYNARKRQEGGDTAANYFKRTEFVAGVKDMRFQALMPDILHWLGVKRIDRFISMSNMKYQAIVDSGIEIVERVSIPEDRMPADSKVEIEAKIADGYFTTGEVPTGDMLKEVKGRNWDEIAH
ncbi:Uracil-regulated protein 1 [Coemansia sp. BCRC 34301]|nr:Uracil-regulated protein 1 [Coemansia sp. BCRC 34301]